MTDEAMDEMYAGVDDEYITKQDIDDVVDFTEAFVNQMYDLVCNPSDDAWVIEWELQKKASKKVTKPVVAAKNTA